MNHESNNYILIIVLASAFLEIQGAVSTSMIRFSITT